jgi:hypothetical protein
MRCPPRRLWLHVHCLRSPYSGFFDPNWTATAGTERSLTLTATRANRETRPATAAMTHRQWLSRPLKLFSTASMQGGRLQAARRHHLVAPVLWTLGISGNSGMGYDESSHRMARKSKTPLIGLIDGSVIVAAVSESGKYDV